MIRLVNAGQCTNIVIEKHQLRSHIDSLLRVIKELDLTIRCRKVVPVADQSGFRQVSR